MASRPPAPAPARPDRRGPPLRWLIIATVLLPLALLAGTLVALSGMTSRRISEQLGTSILDSTVARVQAELRHFLESAVRTSDLYARRIESGVLPLEGLQAWERSELDDLVSDADIASISFGSATGETTWVLRRAGHLEVGRVDTSGRAIEHIISESGAISPEPLREYPYDPRARPWYGAAVGAGGPVWTAIYFRFGDKGSETETGTGYARPIYTGGRLRGVLIVDVTLGRLSAYLASLPIAQAGGIFIVDHQGLVVAASEGRVNSAEGKRRALTELGNPLATAAAASLPSSESAAATRADISGQTAWVRVTPFRPFPGIDWRIVSVIPESTFLAGASAVQRRAGWAAATAILAGVGVALVMSRRLSRPLLAVAGHVRRVGAGDFASRIELPQARELSELSEALNRMAAGLQERVTLQQSLELAKEVQQSLLPAGAPRIPGLDLAGGSRYCESTGGDYFDFIESAGDPAGRVIIAVGDVMGHGIAAALLMATARASLRANAAPGVSLGDLLSRVNDLLTQHTRDGWFMTLALVTIDPATRTLRWASAGHIPPIVYDPAGCFLEPTGGGIPLGIEPGAVYEEYPLGPLAPGAVIVLGTDGIWEARGAGNQMFGLHRLRRLIEVHAAGPGAELVAAIERELEAFCAPARPADDITAVVARLV